MNSLPRLLRLSCLIIALSGLALRAQDPAPTEAPADTNAAPVTVETPAAAVEAPAAPVESTEATNAAPAAVEAPAATVETPAATLPVEAPVKKPVVTSKPAEPSHTGPKKVTVTSNGNGGSVELTDKQAEGVMAIVMASIGLILAVAGAIAVFGIIVGWKLFTKAGKPGWASIVPIYNLVVMLQIAGKPVWWIIFFIVPGLNALSLIFCILLSLGLAKSFGKGTGFAVGLILVPIIFLPMLAFGKAQYLGPDGAAAAPAAA